MSSTLGSPTKIGWKRRSSAASFSMCLRYSSSVVAPTARSSPRASIGFKRLEASTAPSAAPAPTIVWSSSMKRTIWPSAAWISLRTALRRSSNSPRYLEPASSAPMSRAITRRSRSDSGMSPETIRWARPSTIAVLPTPGSPIRTGLFLVRRERTWMTRRISSSRPMTGIELADLRLGGQVAPVLLERAEGVLRVGRGDAMRAADLRDRLDQVLAIGKQIGDARPLLGQGEQDVLGRDVLVAEAGGLLLGLLQDPDELARRAARPGRCCRSAGAACRSPRGPCERASCASTPRRCRTGTTTPSSWSSRARSRWGGATSGFEFSEASRCAAATASWDLTVNRSGCISGQW